MPELSEASPFAYFAGIWWASFIFHFVVGYVLWLTKAGNWAQLIGGRHG
ncbi:hypothetical protein Mal64_36200 [Pseudobythopirellula maris]|uniref:Uncharacterized protein n=1 Tax=Pseudobythopirellula maris TaxID=2527991 RepID=A0A5C5ZI29_9BACT|nr:hypothetical protein Mal64_36200 [Pseudobythopirellula maris]